MSCAPRADRERQVGEWPPEPIITGGQAETACSLSLAVLVLLEKRLAGQ
jgi:hypothetical protein